MKVEKEKDLRELQLRPPPDSQKAVNEFFGSLEDWVNSLLPNFPNQKISRGVNEKVKELLENDVWRRIGEIGSSLEGLKTDDGSERIKKYGKIIFILERALPAPSQDSDQVTFPRAQELSAKAFFAAALYEWVFRNGGKDVLEFFVTSPVAKVDYRGVWLEEMRFLRKVDVTIDKAREILKKLGIKESDLDCWFEKFSWEVTETSRVSSGVQRKEAEKKKNSLLKRAFLLFLLACNLNSSGRVIPSTLDLTYLSLRRVISVGDGGEDTPSETGPETIEVPTSPTSTPSPTPSALVAEAVPSKPPEGDVHRIQNGDWLSKIAQKYWGGTEGSTLAFLTRVLFMINPHLGKDPNNIEVGQEVFVYPQQMKGKFAEVLGFLLEGKGRLEELERLIETLDIPTINSQKEFSAFPKDSNWVIFKNTQGLTLEQIIRDYYGTFGDKSLALINRINHMKLFGEDVVPLIVLPPAEWFFFQIKNNFSPPSIKIPSLEVPKTATASGSGQKKSSATKESTPDSNPVVYYTVKPGDTLSAIAQRFRTTVNAIAAANGINNPNLIYAGQKLIIPGENKKIDSNKGVYRELPDHLVKYVGGYWSTWEEIPEELRQWLIGIIAEEASAHKVPSWTILSVMSAEQLGGFRLESRVSTTSAVEPLGITPGWEMSFFGTDEKRFDFREQVRMVASRLAKNGLTVEVLENEGEETYRRRLEVYLCKHLAGEGNHCGEKDAIRGVAAAPGSRVTVQDYVKIGADTAQQLQGPEIVEDVQKVIAAKVAEKIGEPEAPPVVSAEEAKAVVDGKKPLEEVVQNTKMRWLEEQVAKVLLTKASRESLSLPSKQDLWRVNEEAQKILGRQVAPEEIAQALAENQGDVEKAIQSFQNSPEVIIFQYAQEVWRKVIGKNPTDLQIREVVKKAMEVWEENKTRSSRFMLIEAAKKRVEEAVERDKISLPLDPCCTKVGVPFGAPSYFQPEGHTGVDYAAKVGDPILAVKGGEVVLTDWLFGVPGTSTGHGYTVVIKDADGRYYVYAHCKEGSFEVKVGDIVQAGQKIAQIGMTGATSAPHLHFAVLGPKSDSSLPVKDRAALENIGVPDNYEWVNPEECLQESN